VLAPSVTHNYYGHHEFATHAPGLKTLADAVAIRNKLLQAFEQAEAEADPRRHRDLLTFVLVGAGPTGVEMAGAISSLVRNSLKSEFRRIDPTSARIVLLDVAPRVLGTFSERLSTAALKRLEDLGVEIRLGHPVDHVDADGVIVAGERIFSKTVIWTAGVAPSPAGHWLTATTDRAGRVRVQADLSVPGHPEIFVIGDTASLDQDGHPLPGVAQVAIQQGRYAGKLIHRRLTGGPPPLPFRYFDKGNMAVVGKGFAVLQSESFQLIRVRGLACVGGSSPPLPRPKRPARECLCSMDLDLEKYALLNEHAEDYTTMTDKEAENYVRGRAAVEQAILQVRLRYFPQFREVLSGKSTALFFQLDWRLGLVMDLQLASQTPLIEP
jgi:NADH dehydrogenase FAD-containing subunit